MFVGLGNEMKRRVNLKYAGPCEVHGVKSRLAAELRLGEEPPRVISLSGKDSATELGLSISPNKVVRVELGVVTPLHHVFIQPNPALFEGATVQCVQLLEPEEVHALHLVIQARSSIDLAAFDWLVRLYGLT